MSDPQQSKSGLRRALGPIRAAAWARHGASAGERLALHGLAFLQCLDGLDPLAPTLTPPGSPVRASGTACDRLPLLSAFHAMRDEIPTLPLMAALDRAGYALALPVIPGKAVPLLFRRWKPGDPLATGPLKVQEPLASAPQVEPDILLVPLLAFDARGYRLGYGGGYYDRTLARLRALKPVLAVGLAFDEQEVAEVPAEAYDERVDWVLTPSGARRLGI